ncbi:hypothetical protein FOIG_11476 [Fusarium odoratissimum NRRL 54006]|uniref:Uncharacterized protein n=1 Tax=Fusarium odoratissimum (strain NRRL 54006) TaxID=1089451 RepID=X0J424_FUSO5|nr:uncharacterized protein FOIG_11476 [Fusarium odoratissimum NRRL 54006]EWZ80553.1 hypothetical protein FOWG_15283 [Fusarium oxysporum f. sp. lycopersici MN25]EXL95933.1 hypothetical protein FOIG_11476 [Fusarium odoratissimum NRRL 54006]
MVNSIGFLFARLGLSEGHFQSQDEDMEKVLPQGLH